MTYRCPLLVCALNPVSPSAFPENTACVSGGASSSMSWQVHQRSNGNFSTWKQHQLINLMCSPSLRSVAGIPIHLHWYKLSNAQRCSIDHSAVLVSVQLEKGLSEQQRTGQLLRGSGGCSTKGPLCIWTKSKRVHCSSFIVWDVDTISRCGSYMAAFFPHIRCQIGRTVSVAKPHTSTSPLTCLNLRFGQARHSASPSPSLYLTNEDILFWRRKIGHASEVQQPTRLTSNK